MKGLTNQQIKKAGIIMLVIGAIGAALIAIISLSIYGKIYFYDGYAYTGFLWTICFILIMAGIAALCISLPKFRSVLSTSKGRFILIGVVYAIFFVIFVLTGHILYYVLMTAMFAVGLTIYIVHHYVTNSKTLTEGTKSEILEKREKQKLFYSKVIAICLPIAIGMTLLCTIPTNNNNDDYDPYECFWCNGTGMAYDAYGKLHYCSHCNGSGRQ